MSERRVPRFEDDYSAELPTWPPRMTNAPRPSINDEPSPGAGPQAEALLAGTGTGTPAGREGRPGGEAGGAGLPIHPTAACRLPAHIPPQGDDRAPPAVPSVRSLAGGTALSDSAELLLGLIGAHHGESRERAIERAVAFYADRIGIAALARPMPCGGGYPTPALRADPPREGEGGRGGAPP